MLADPVTLDIGAVGEALFVRFFNCQLADHRFSVWGHVDEGFLGRRQVALLYSALGTGSGLGLRDYCRQRNDEWNQRFPQFHSQIFRDYAENCVDSDEATV